MVFSLLNRHCALTKAEEEDRLVLPLHTLWVSLLSVPYGPVGPFLGAGLFFGDARARRHLRHPHLRY